MLPRLIDDKRRKRRLIAFTSLVLLVTTTGVGWLNIRDINERWRNEGLALLHDLQAYAAWLENEMDASRDADGISPKLDALSIQLAVNDNISMADVDFALRTRKAECQADAQAVARQCMTSLGELSDLREHLFSLLSDGTNVMVRLTELSASNEALEIGSTRKTCLSRCDELQRFCARKIMLSWDYGKFMDGHRKLVDYISSKKVSNSDWSKIGREHLAYVVWTNDLANSLASYEKTGKYVRERFASLQQFPFDRANTVDLTRKKMNEELRRTEPLVPAGMDLFSNSSRRVDEALSQYQASATVALESLSAMQKTHGDFVDATCVTSASQLVDSFESLRQSANKSIVSHIATIRARLDKVTKAREIVEQGLLSLGDNGAADERLARICETGLKQVLNLSDVGVGLETSVMSLSNYVAKVQSEAKEKADSVAASLRMVEQSLPDWRAEGNKTIKDLDGIRRDVIGVRTSADNLNKTFVYCRDNNNHGTMSSLRKRMDKTFEMLKSLEAGCTGTFPCSNGIELKALMQRRDKAKRLVELVNQKVLDLSQDADRFLADGTLRKIKFVEYTESFSSQLQNGVRHFDFALEIPSGGRHQIEIRFAKGGRSLYKMSPQKKHNVVMKCVVSGVQNKETKLSWEDMTSSWRGSITLDGDFGAGINDICLDLSFSAEGFRGESMPGGTWQYQYDSGFFSSSIQDNFGVEFWVDGIKRNALWGVPAQ